MCDPPISIERTLSCGVVLLMTVMDGKSNMYFVIYSNIQQSFAQYIRYLNIKSTEIVDLTHG